jgi:hypothetical protein
LEEQIMTTPRRSRFELDLALLEATDTRLWPIEDREELDRLRSEDRVFLEHHPRRETVGDVLLDRRRRRPWLGAFMAAAALTALAIIYPRDDGLRAKGESAITMFVKRDAAITPYQGELLAKGDALVFRYTTKQRHLVLAGREDTGRTSVYWSSPIDPGFGRTLPIGIELDDHVGMELVVALFSDGPIADVTIEWALDRANQEDAELPAAFDRTVWQIQKGKK